MSLENWAAKERLINRRPKTPRMPNIFSLSPVQFMEKITKDEEKAKKIKAAIEAAKVLLSIYGDVFIYISQKDT